MKNCLVCLAAAAVMAAAGENACPVGANIRGHENIEWSIGYGFHLTDKNRNLPRVLLVGDSICNGYQGGVQKLLDGKVNVSYWVSSYCLTMPSYRALLTVYLDECRYDVIHFNNGLHSLGRDPKVWGAALKETLKLIRAKQPQAKLVLCTSTPLKKPELTEKAKALNAAALDAIKDPQLGAVAVNDLFALLDPLDREKNWSDVFHHRPPLREQEARQVADAVLKALGR